MSYIVNANKPAFTEEGLTKREQIALTIFSGLLSSATQEEKRIMLGDDGAKACTNSIKLADTFLMILNALPVVGGQNID